MVYEIRVTDAKTSNVLATIATLSPTSTIADVKRAFERIRSKYYPERQSFRTEPRGKSLKDDQTLESLGMKSSGELFFKDLGPQVGWTTVFLTEYAGPLAIYLGFYSRPAIIYGAEAALQPKAFVVDIAAACWTFHYAKRLFETVFVHRFSHATMPIFNIFKNSMYYWGFAVFVAYFVNHPLYTPAAFGNLQIYGSLAAFVFAELGNLSIHLALRNLRPAGSKVRRIPYPSANPFTWLFTLVSCPNYTYEALAWVSFTVMTQCLPVGLFTLAGFGQMTAWAFGKHRNYRKEFKDYPRGRKPILPFLL
ncbi:very-long-chain enoyl-CoA reductase-like [Haliotis asinina]|uniref:very-long-chain enoyl-CoA reductase-like n=1 Tax=Haliotis asinina TaxID=109174 RepID=UPI003531BF7E